jgi:hypothetical protein
MQNMKSGRSETQTGFDRQRKEGIDVIHIAVKSVPRLLVTDQKEHQVTICFELKEQTASNPSFISTIITGDDSWVYGYCQHEGAIISMKDTKFTVIQESKTSLKLCQINVDLFFLTMKASKQTPWL